MRFIGFLFLSVFLIASCAHLSSDETTNTKAMNSKSSDGSSVSNSQAVNKEAIASNVSESSDGESSVDEVENLTIDDVIGMEEVNTQNIYDDSRYDFPITMNGRVEGWMDYFTGRGRHHFERYLGRSSRFIPLMKEVFKKDGLPEDLVYLAMIESGFNLHAKSRAKAVGPWQFMKATGKRYGLRVDGWIDERRDPLRATVAAAKYLKDLYLMFESWYLAASAYNAGEGKILRAVEQLKTNNFWRISQTRMIRRETKDYIPKLIAAAIMAKNPKKYGFDDIDYLEPYEFESIVVNFPVLLSDVAKLVDVPEEDLVDLNPELRRKMVPPREEGYELRIPVGSKVVVERALNSKREAFSVRNIPNEYMVQSGENLKNIAKKFGIRVSDLIQLNNLNPKEKIQPGMVLLVPELKGNRNLLSVNRSVKQSLNEHSSVTHTVQRGESLWSISEQYNVTVQDLFKWNQLKKSKIFPGRRLVIRPPKA